MSRQKYKMTKLRFKCEEKYNREYYKENYKESKMIIFTVQLQEMNSIVFMSRCEGNLYFSCVPQLTTRGHSLSHGLILYTWMYSASLIFWWPLGPSLSQPSEEGRHGAEKLQNSLPQ